MAKKKKGINGKRSGNSFERDWAKKLSLWITEGERNDAVWRTSNSGGKATVTGSDTQCGDLHAVRPEAYPFFDLFSVELKNYKPIQLLHFDRKNCELYKWWKQATTDAKKANKIPLVIFNAKRIGQYFVVDSTTEWSLAKLSYLSLSIADPSMTIIPPKEISDVPLIIRPIDQFFDFFNILEINNHVTP